MSKTRISLTIHSLVLIAIIIVSNQAYSQQAQATRRLTLSEAVNIAQIQNYDIKIADAEKNEASGDFTKSGSVFLPQLSVSETFVSTNDPLNVFGLKLKQQRVTMADFDPTVLNSPDQFQNFSTKAEVRQPIFNLDGFFGRHAASRGLEAADYKLLRTRNAIALRVKMEYFGLVLARQSLNVIQQALATAKSYRNQAGDFLDQGLIQKSDYLMADVRVLELQSKLLEAKNNSHDAERSLRYSLGMTGDNQIEPADSLQVLSSKVPQYNIDEIFSRRSDMLSLKAAVDATSALTNMYRAKIFPSLNAFASYELNNDMLAGTRGRNWMVGAMLKWDLFTGLDQVGDIQKASAKHSSLEAESEKTKALAFNEIQSAVQSFESSITRITLADASVAQAEEQYRIVSDRYAQGLERTPDVLRAETTLFSTRLDRLNTLFQHSSTLFLLEYLLEQKLTP